MLLAYACASSGFWTIFTVEQSSLKSNVSSERKNHYITKYIFRVQLKIVGDKKTDTLKWLVFHLLKHFHWLHRVHSAHVKKLCEFKLKYHYHHICCQIPTLFRLLQNGTHIHFNMFFVFVTELNPLRQNNGKLTPFPKALWNEKLLQFEVYAHFGDQCNLTHLHGFWDRKKKEKRIDKLSRTMRALSILRSNQESFTAEILKSFPIPFEGDSRTAKRAVKVSCIRFN